MNAHNEQQPTAAQEALAWRDHDAAIDAKALSTATEIALMWGQDRSQFISRIQVAVIDAMRWVKGGLQTAAAQGAVLCHMCLGTGQSPTGDGGRLENCACSAVPAGAIAAMALCANAEPQGTPEGWEKYWDATPAAPGIDLREIGGVMAEAEKHVETLHSLCPRASVFECIKRLRKAQAALIDASPKGTTLNEQFGSAKGLGSASHYRQVLERIATQGPHYGPDGTRETWKHWSDIARDALVDSPKGGSEAEVQELVAADLAYDAAEQALVDHYKPTLRRDAGWHLEQERLDAIADSAIARRSAALAAMQASDAEVRDGE